jgi:antitoxin component YwqK of YwqJK toxin-antitoxin module
MKFLIVLLAGMLSLSCFAQVDIAETELGENALLMQVFKNKIGSKVSLNQDDVKVLLGSADEDESVLKDVLIPQLSQISGPSKKAKYIKFLNNILAELEIYFTDFNNMDGSDGLVSKYQDAETAFLTLVNSLPQYQPRTTTENYEDQSTYYEDGTTLKSETYWEKLSDGSISSKFVKEYSPEGKLEKITSYYEDETTPKSQTYWEARPDGSFGSKFVREYSPEGKLEKITNYVEKGIDKLQDIREYYESGKTSRAYTYKNGKPNGMLFVYNEKGQTIKKEKYNEDGKLDGTSLIYGKNGRVAWMIKYSAGQRLSVNKYKETGEIESTRTYENDILVSTNKPEYGEDGKYIGRTFTLADGTTTKFDASNNVVGDVTIYQPVWTEDKINKRLNYYATHAVEERNVTELLTQGLIKTLIANATTSKDVTRIEQLLDGISSGDFVISGSKKQMIGSLRGKLNTAKETITAKETALDASNGRLYLILFTGMSTSSSGKELVDAAMNELVEDIDANGGKFSSDALVTFARSDVMEYMGYFAESKAAQSILTGIGKILPSETDKVKADYYDSKEFTDLKVKMYEYYNSMKMIKK